MATFGELTDRVNDGARLRGIDRDTTMSIVAEAYFRVALDLGTTRTRSPLVPAAREMSVLADFGVEDLVELRHVLYTAELEALEYPMVETSEAVIVDAGVATRCEGRGRFAWHGDDTLLLDHTPHSTALIRLSYVARPERPMGEDDPLPAVPVELHEAVFNCAMANALPEQNYGAAGQYRAWYQQDVAKAKRHALRRRGVSQGRIRLRKG